MAHKKANPVEEPPAASSTEEEESSSSGEEVSSSEEEEETQKQAQAQAQTQTSAPLANNTVGSDSEVETDSEYESESEAEPEQPTVKPLATKPIEETSKKSRPLATLSTPPPKSTAAKRSSDADLDTKNSKRVKKTDSIGGVEESEDTSKQLFQRIFSEDDEVALLEGVIEFKSKNGIDPGKDMSAFHDFIKRSVHFDVSVSQLKAKISRLRKKFENNLKRSKITFSNPHDQKVFNLSKKIWGSDSAANGVESSVKSSGKAKSALKSDKLSSLKVRLGMDEAKEVEEGKVVGMENVTKKNAGRSNLGSSNAANLDMIVSGGIEEFVLKEGLSMVDGATRADMEEKWRDLRIAELKLYLQRNQLMGEQAKIMLDSLENKK